MKIKFNDGRATFDGMTFEEVGDALNLLSSLTSEASQIREARSCRDCRHRGSNDAVFCNRWSAEIPDGVADEGCEEWRYDEVPF
jgi:hypothetical protein